jgi:hypothetical protein
MNSFGHNGCEGNRIRLTNTRVIFNVRAVLLLTKENYIPPNSCNVTTRYNMRFYLYVAPIAIQASAQTLHKRDGPFVTEVGHLPRRSKSVPIPSLQKSGICPDVAQTCRSLRHRSRAFAQTLHKRDDPFRHRSRAFALTLHKHDDTFVTEVGHLPRRCISVTIPSSQRSGICPDVA